MQFEKKTQAQVYEFKMRINKIFWSFLMDLSFIISITFFWWREAVSMSNVTAMLLLRYILGVAHYIFYHNILFLSDFKNMNSRIIK